MDDQLINKKRNIWQGHNHGENLGSTSTMVGRICPPPGGDRVRVSKNLGATSVAPVAPVDTSLVCTIPMNFFMIFFMIFFYNFLTNLLTNLLTNILANVFDNLFFTNFFS